MTKFYKYCLNNVSMQMLHTYIIEATPWTKNLSFLLTNLTR